MNRGGPGKWLVFRVSAPGFESPDGARSPEILSVCPSITHDKIRGGGRRRSSRVCREFCRNRLSPTKTVDRPRQKSWRDERLGASTLSRVFVATVDRPHFAVDRPQ